MTYDSTLAESVEVKEILINQNLTHWPPILTPSTGEYLLSGSLSNFSASVGFLV